MILEDQKNLTTQMMKYGATLKEYKLFYAHNVPYKNNLFVYTSSNTFLQFMCVQLKIGEL